MSAVLDRCVQHLDREWSADLLLSVASAALSSMRRSTVAKPLPSGLDADQALALLEPLQNKSVAELRSSLSALSKETLSFLDFLFTLDVVAVRKVSVSKWAATVPQSAKFLPDAVFEVEYGVPQSAAYPNAIARAKHAEFCKRKNEIGDRMQLAYHGTELCNVYNILREGLKSDPNIIGRNGQAFGKGIYLSEDPVVAQNFLHFGNPWTNSKFGSSAACLLECEVLVDDLQVHRGTDKANSRMPEKYILVENDCLVRVKRVLVYGQKKTPAVAKDMRWLGTLLMTLLALVLLLWIVSKNHKVAQHLTLFTSKK